MPYRDPEKSRSYFKEYRRLRREGDRCSTPVHPTLPPEFRRRTAADVLQAIEEEPEKSRSYFKEYRRLRREGDRCSTPVHPTLPPEFRLRTAADVLQAIEE